jgi:hypothetical protein
MRLCCTTAQRTLFFAIDGAQLWTTTTSKCLSRKSCQRRAVQEKPSKHEVLEPLRKQAPSHCIHERRAATSSKSLQRVPSTSPFNQLLQPVASCGINRPKAVEGKQAHHQGDATKNTQQSTMRKTEQQLNTTTLNFNWPMQLLCPQQHTQPQHSPQLQQSPLPPQHCQ